LKNKSKFVYFVSAASLFEDSNNKLGNNNNNKSINKPKKNRRKPANTIASKRAQQDEEEQQNYNEGCVISDSESTISAEDEQLVPVGPSSTIHWKQISIQSSEKFTFSSLMRQMAQKYQEKNEIANK